MTYHRAAASVALDGATAGQERLSKKLSCRHARMTFFAKLIYKNPIISVTNFADLAGSFDASCVVSLQAFVLK
jgi:hypothetical protein